MRVPEVVSKPIAAPAAKFVVPSMEAMSASVTALETARVAPLATEYLPFVEKPGRLLLLVIVRTPALIVVVPA